MLSEVSIILTKSFAWYLVGNILFGLNQWLIILFIIRFGSSTELGVYTYGIAVIVPLILFMSFGFNTLIVTDNAIQKRTILLLRCYCLTASLLIYAVIVTVSTNLMHTSFLLLFVVAISKLAEAALDINFAYFIKTQNYSKIGFYKIAMTCIQLILLVICYVYFQSLVMAVFLYSVIIVFIFIKLNINHLFRAISGSLCLKLLKLGLPLSFTLALSSLNTNIPKYILESVSTIDNVGIFSSLLVIYSAGNTLFFSIYNYLLPKVVERKALPCYLWKLLLYILGLCFISGFIFIVIIQYNLTVIIQTLFTSSYIHLKKEFMNVILGSIFVYSSILFDLFINAYQKYIYNTFIQVLSVGLVAIASIIFIPSFDIYGATLAFLIFGITVSITKLIISIMIIQRGNI